VLADEKAVTAVAILRRTVAFYRSPGVEVERVMTTTVPRTARRLTRWPAGCSAFATSVGARTGRVPTGRAGRFIRTMLNESLYAAIHQNSEQRRVALAGWYRALQRTQTPWSLGGQIPMARLRQSQNNVLGAHI
jgi:hypothetical protein